MLTPRENENFLINNFALNTSWIMNGSEHCTLAETFSNISTDYLRLFNRLSSHILFYWKLISSSNLIVSCFELFELFSKVNLHFTFHKTFCFVYIIIGFCSSDRGRVSSEESKIWNSNAEVNNNRNCRTEFKSKYKVYSMSAVDSRQTPICAPIANALFIV